MGPRLTSTMMLHLDLPLDPPDEFWRDDEAPEPPTEPDYESMWEARVERRRGGRYADE